MAIIDKITGYYGFTIDIDPENPAINNNGEVKTCLIAFTFNQQTSDVDVTVSQGEDDFAVKTGDGQIIPCRNPKVIYTNRDNAIVQFDMEREYPANSPLSLVYHSNTAKFTIDQRANGRPFEVNSVSGHFAYTVEGYKGSNITDKGFDGSDKYTGLVNKVMATVPFKYSPTAVRAELSQGENDWGIRMGNGQIIPLKNPEVVTVNQNNFIALFTMHDGYSYPSNSPGILVYRSASAKIEVIPQDDDNNFYPVRNIYDVPASMISGQTIDLNCAKVEPFNASVQYINWSVVSGPGEIIDGHYLHATKGGSIIINGTIENGLEGDDLSNDYFQRFTIETVQNVITKFTDPIPEIKTYVGEINHTIAVVAESSTDRISYQWYHNTADSYTDATPITKDGNNASYVIPETLAKGDHYYFCKIMSDGAVDVLSAKCHIYASIRCTSITIYPLDNTMGWESSRQMRIEQYPSDADLPVVKWFSSNDNIAKFDETIDPGTGLLVKPGLLHSKFPEIRKDGDELTAHDIVTITAVTTDILGEQLSASLDIMIHTFVPVTDITGLKLDLTTNNSYKLSGTVEPSNATNKDIVWSVVDSNGTAVNITGDTLNIPSSVIPKDHLVSCTIMATIKNGSTTHNKFQKVFSVFITHGFIPVTDIVLNTDNSKLYDIGNAITLDASTLPQGSSTRNIVWSVLNDAAEIHNNTLIFTTAGDITVRATVPKGAGTVINQYDFVKDFTFRCSNQRLVSVQNVNLVFHHTKIIKTPVIGADGPTGEYLINKQETIDEYLDPYEKVVVGNEETDTDLIVSGEYQLPFVIDPEDASNTNIKVSMISFLCKEEPVQWGLPEYVMPEDFLTTGWQSVPAGTFSVAQDGTVSFDKEKLIAGNLYLASIRVNIYHGVSSSEDYVQDLRFFVKPISLTPFIPITEMIYDIKPIKLRAYSPILLSKYDVEPFNATVFNNMENHIIAAPAENGVQMNYEMEMIIDHEKDELGPQPVFFFGEGTEMGTTVPPLDVFLFGQPEYYLYAWNPGKCKITITYDDSTVTNLAAYNKYYPEKAPYSKTFEFEFLPPFIPVNKIIGVAKNIFAGQSYVIAGEVDNYGTLQDYNPGYDDEDVTNKDIIWSIVSNNCGATLVGNVLTAASAGIVTIRGTVIEGLAERVEWYYDRVQEAQNYTEDFVITVAAQETAFSRNIVTLTLTDNSKVNVDKFGELNLLCTPAPSDSIITIKGKAFRKDQVTRADFYENIHNDLTVNFTGTPTSTVEFDKDDTVIRLENHIDTNPYSVGWEIISGDSTNATLTSNNQNAYANLNIADAFAVNGTVKVRCTVIAKKADGTADNEGKTERDIEFKKIATRPNSWVANPNCTDLTNFGRNFTNLTAINRIPDEVTKLKNFLRGCSHFNSALVIPNGVTGDGCLEFFLRDCVAFNSNITIPDGVTGDSSMHGFLMGCTHFNRAINIPSAIAGWFCMKKFMYKCYAFNQPITIPRGLNGFQCMFEFMAYCHSFNQPITLPDDVGDFMRPDSFTGVNIPVGMQLDNMLFCANNFHSTITVPAATGLHGMVSEKTFGCANYNVPMIQYGITLDGPGANSMFTRPGTSKLVNAYELVDGNIPWAPYRHITNLD